MSQRWRFYVRYKQAPNGQRVFEGFVGIWWCLIAVTLLCVGTWMVAR